MTIRATEKCPFCGSFDAEVVDEEDCGYVYCNFCGASSKIDEDIDEVIKSWNRLSRLSEEDRAKEGNQTYPYKEDTVKSVKSADSAAIEVLAEGNQRLVTALISVVNLIVAGHGDPIVFTSDSNRK